MGDSVIVCLWPVVFLKYYLQRLNNCHHEQVNFLLTETLSRTQLNGERERERDSNVCVRESVSV